MPGKKKKGGDKKKKGGKKKGAKAAAEKEEIVKKSRELLRTYQQHCSLPGRICSLEVVKYIKEDIESEKPPMKFFLDGSTLETAAVPKPDKSSTAQDPLKPGPAAAPKPDKPSTGQDPKPDEPSATQDPAMSATPTFPSKVVQPLIDSWVQTRYSFVCAFYCWNLTLDDDAIVSLALYFESPVGSTMRTLELREAAISPWAVSRLARSLKRAQLVSINLDFNRIPKHNLEDLCRGLQLCRTIENLSLNFCRLDYSCGRILGSYVATSIIKEVSLIGNTLTCSGCSDLIKPIIELHSASEATPTPDATPPVNPGGDSGRPAGDTTEPAESVVPAPVQRVLPAPPSLRKLFLQDNGIDLYTPCSTGTFHTVLCTREIKKLLLSSAVLEEINLEGNALGDGGAREVMEGLQQRKEKGLAPVKVSLSSQVSKEIFESIVELSVVKRAKKKGKKKTKK